MKKIVSLLLMLLLLITIVGCDKEIALDYENSTTFEEALNNGEDLTGKIVKAKIVDVKPNSMFGYNLISGEHLNFVSEKNPNVKVDEEVTIKVNEVSSMLGSWIIKYDIVK